MVNQKLATTLHDRIY